MPPVHEDVTLTYRRVRQRDLRSPSRMCTGFLPTTRISSFTGPLFLVRPQGRTRVFVVTLRAAWFVLTGVTTSVVHEVNSFTKVVSRLPPVPMTAPTAHQLFVRTHVDQDRDFDRSESTALRTAWIVPGDGLSSLRNTCSGVALSRLCDRVFHHAVASLAEYPFE